MFDYSMAFAGLGMFLFGMIVLEQSLKAAAGSKFKILLKKYTDGIFRSVATGAISTAILQSSSLVSLMVLAFVGAGLMGLTNAIGVIIGANIGTTATSWIVAFLGFKVKVDVFAMPMIGLGGLGLVLFGNTPKKEAMFKLIVGFGLLFLGLDFMKESMSALSQVVDLSQWKNYDAIFFLLIGLLLTAVIQSSSAAVAIVLSALGGGVIDFHIAAAMVIGTNIGTTITAQIAAIGGTPDKKRVSLAHFIFNFVTAIFAYFLIKPMSYLVLEVLNMENDPVLAIAMFHTIFNILGLLLFIGVIGQFSKMLSKMYQKQTKSNTPYIDDVDPLISEVSTVALNSEVERFFEKSIEFILLMINISPNEIIQKKRKASAVVYSSEKVIEIDLQEQYKRLKDIEGKILTYAGKIKNLSPEDQKVVKNSINALKESMYAVKAIKDIKHNVDEFMSGESGYAVDKCNSIRHRLTKLAKNIIDFPKDPSSVKTREKIKSIIGEIKTDDENAINIISEAISQGHISQTQAPAFITLNRAVFNSSDSLLDAALLLGNVKSLDINDSAKAVESVANIEKMIEEKKENAFI